jgi:hypothetical protein
MRLYDNYDAFKANPYDEDEKNRVIKHCAHYMERNATIPYELQLCFDLLKEREPEYVNSYLSLMTLA